MQVCGINCEVTSASTTSVSCQTGSKLNVGKAHELLKVGVTASEDDAAERDDGRMYLTKTTLTLPVEGTRHMLTALRFKGVAVERGAIVHSARVQFQVDAAQPPP